MSGDIEYCRACEHSYGRAAEGIAYCGLTESEIATWEAWMYGQPPVPADCPLEENDEAD